MWSCLMMIALAQTPAQPVPETESPPAALRYLVAGGIVGVETGARIRSGLLAGQVGVRRALTDYGGVSLTYLVDGGSEGTEKVGVVSSRHRLQLGLYWEHRWQYGGVSVEAGVHPLLESSRLYATGYKRETQWSQSVGTGTLLRGFMPAGEWGNLGLSVGLLQRRQRVDVWIGMGAEL